MWDVGHLSAAATARLLRRFSSQLGKSSERFFLFDRKIGRDLDFGIDAEIAATPPSQVRGTQSGESEYRSGLGPGRYFQFFRSSFEKRHIDFDP